MHATKVDTEPVRRSRMLPVALAAAALLVIGLVIAAVVLSRDDAPAVHAPAAGAQDTPSADQVATGFLQAYGALDEEQVIGYLADDATIASLTAQDDPRLLLAWLEATGYEQFLQPCEQVGNSASGSVRCPFEFQALRSSEIGRGPFGGSTFELVVQDGKVAHVSQSWNISAFSPQVWEPFARWVSKTHPKDVAVMYLDESQSVPRLSDESIRLWDQNTQKYVDEVKPTG